MNRQLLNRIEQLEDAGGERRATVFYWEGQSREAVLAAYQANHPESRGAEVDFVEFRWLRADEAATR
jgi:hypothetical protein